MGKIHTTVGVYNNDTYKTNGVSEENLEGHIIYNETFRPGRALFVDGKCVHQGYLSQERCDEWEKKLADVKILKDTQPYH